MHGFRSVLNDAKHELCKQLQSNFCMYVYFIVTFFLEEYPEEETKMYCGMKPTMLIERRGDSVYMKFEMAPNVTYEITFKFGEHFETKDHLKDPPSFHNKV